MRSNREQSGDGTPSTYPFDQACDPGCYPARVGSAKEGKGRTSGTPQVDLVLNIDGNKGPTALHFWVQATGGMAWTFGQAVKALLPAEDVAAFLDGGDVELVADELVGLHCRVQVGVEKVKDQAGELTGETKPRVLGLLPPDGPPAGDAKPATKPAAKPAMPAKDAGGDW